MAEKFLFINSNKKDSLCEHVIFERTMNQSPGFSNRTLESTLSRITSVNDILRNGGPRNGNRMIHN